MRSIIQELCKIRRSENLSIDNSNTNRYRVVCNEADGSKTAYYFGVPIYDASTRELVNLRFYEKGDVCYHRGSNADVSLSEHIKIENCYGDCILNFGDGYQYQDETCVEYKNVRVVPTLNGIACEASLSSFSFSLTLSNPFFFEKYNNKQISIMREKFKPFLTISSIGGLSAEGRVVAPATVKYQKRAPNEFLVNISSNCIGAERLLFEINLQEEKLIQDTTVESANVKTNNVFGSVAFVGTTALYGEQWVYSRPDFSKLKDLFGKKINNATILYPTLDNGNAILSAYALEMRFCSFGSNWENKKPVTVKRSTGERLFGYQKINITEMVVQNNRLFELSQGWVLKRSGGTSSFCTISTGDSFINPLIVAVNYTSIENGDERSLLSVATKDKIILASRKEIVNAVRSAIPKCSTEEKYSYIVEYDPNEKVFFFSCLELMRCQCETRLDFFCAVVVLLTVEQIKTLRNFPCVERIERNYEYLPCDFDVGDIVKAWKEIPSECALVNMTMAEVLGDFDDENKTKKLIDAVLLFESVNLTFRRAIDTASIIWHIYRAINLRVSYLHLASCSQYKSFFLEKILEWGKRAGVIITSSRSKDPAFPYPAEFKNIIPL